MTARPFGKHPGWKKPIARKRRDKARRLQTWAEKDSAFWDSHLEEIVERRQARVSAAGPSTAERLAAKRAAWRQPTE